MSLYYVSDIVWYAMSYNPKNYVIVYKNEK